MFLDKINNYNIVLFSGSPRRSEIMKGAGIRFNVYNGYDVDEVYPDEIEASDVAKYLSHLKASSYPLDIGANDVIITADTIVVLDKVVFGKPKDETDAIKMLNTLSGRTHSVITACSVRTADNIHTFDVETLVTFKSFDKDEIAHYVATYKPFDKAGSYGIQEWIGYIGVEKIEGSYFNVMGLPICRLCKELIEILKQ